MQHAHHALFLVSSRNNAPYASAHTLASSTFSTSAICLGGLLLATYRACRLTSLLDKDRNTGGPWTEQDIPMCCLPHLPLPPAAVTRVVLLFSLCIARRTWTGLPRALSMPCFAALIQAHLLAGHKRALGRHLDMTGVTLLVGARRGHEHHPGRTEAGCTCLSFSTLGSTLLSPTTVAITAYLRRTVPSLRIAVNLCLSCPSGRQVWFCRTLYAHRRARTAHAPSHTGSALPTRALHACTVTAHRTPRSALRHLLPL